MLNDILKHQMMEYRGMQLQRMVPDVTVVWTHCTRCMQRTDHLFTNTGKHGKLVCLDCHPEMRKNDPE